MKIEWGRVLVYVNLVLALGMGTWAFGLYTGRVDWSNNPAKGTQAPGELAKRQATLKGVDNALATAGARQITSLASLRLFEQRRPRDQQFFAKELAHLQNGIDAQNPLKTLDIQNGQIVLTPDGLPKMISAPFKDRRGQPLKSLSTYEDELKATQTALLAAITQYKQLVEEDARLTGLIVGDKGLRQLLFDEEDVKQARIKQEIEDLKPVYINLLVESQLLKKRQKALEARKGELSAAGTRTTQR